MNVLMFQSLFWWISCWDEFMILEITSKICFNPCSGGLAVGTLQSILRCSRTSGFNPCSGGLAVGTNGRPNPPRRCIVVSILVLVD